MEGRNRSSESCAIGIPAEQQPRPHQLPNSTAPVYRNEEEAARARCRYLCLLCVAIIVIIIVFVFRILFAINKWNNPKFGLNSLSVSNFNISGSEISGIWDVEFLAKSPDFLFTNNYPHPTLAVYYQNQQLLLGKKLPRIHLPRKKTISYRVNALAMATSIQDKGVADAIANEWSQQKVVAFTVTLQPISPHNGHRWIVNVVCAHVKVGFSSNSTSSSSQGTLLPESSANNKNTHRQAFTRCSNTYL
ncbi:hypothetical protein CCACVL1_16406 [Corchorus capsularis]|uniref:Late embryogenesis abundant protein, LEA-14 n=1 Tax=Corchorus capsularis TaxID=210143 RepID=A0A1R3HXC2_COCAP|nr:hypothetical protein CCACVL1_16406 [Corchorus capsularis]